MAWSQPQQSASLHDFLMRYLRRNFAADLPTAEIAFAAFNTCAQYGDYRNLLYQVVHPYIYTYVAAGKPYPRRYPAEALSWLAQNRDENLAVLDNIHRCAHQAVVNFTALAEQPNVNRQLARLLALESRNYDLLSGEFIFMLKNRYLDGQKLDQVSLREVERMITLRTAFMADMIDIKAHYLQASELRSASTLLQILWEMRESG